MADAKARAAARRQAILASKSDRLAKLTTKAKNEGDVAGAVRDIASDPPLAELPTHGHGERQRTGFDAQTDDSSLLFAQDQLSKLHTLLAANSRESTPQLSDTISEYRSAPFVTQTNPLGDLYRESEPKPLVEKVLPLLHVFSTILFVVFTLWRHGAFSSSDRAIKDAYWNQWESLQYREPMNGWFEDSRHVLWSFMVLQVVLHATRLSIHTSKPRVPMVLGLLMPHLPPPVPTLLYTLIRYINMLGLLLDDISFLVVALGFLIFSASYKY